MLGTSTVEREFRIGVFDAHGGTSLPLSENFLCYNSLTPLADETE
jgi:hypothetical protein